MTLDKTSTAADIIAMFEASKAAMEARSIPVGTYVLRWDNGLFVGFDTETKKARATGFEHCTFFGDREAARSWQRLYQVANGKGEMPAPVLAFNARQGAMLELDGHIKTIRQHIAQEA